MIYGTVMKLSEEQNKIFGDRYNERILHLNFVSAQVSLMTVDYSRLCKQVKFPNILSVSENVGFQYFTMCPGYDFSNALLVRTN